MAAVELVEVGPRDGLQNAPRSFPPTLRAELCRRAAAAGIARVEAVSFVREDAVPQMAGAADVIAELADDDLTTIGLVLNPRGLELLAATGAREARVVVIVSDALSRRNSNISSEDGLRAGVAMVQRARELGLHTGAVVATAFGCPFSGEVPQADVLRVAETLAGAGAHELIFADTIGVGAPREVRSILTSAAGFGPRLGVHLHNTRNTGYANALAAVESGATILDSAIGGLGGCPFSPGASGNVATEDLVYLLEREGIQTGLDLDRLIGAAKWLEEATGLELPGSLHRVPPFPPAPAAQSDVRLAI
ncbi:MAG: hydroxymethylglutaryl-CoA lyase [Solirubrobacteraceae bacterium]|nr:hydroxymethylglutaryl-CoA lyase [Solirubrobacteraceae bacterium]